MLPREPLAIEARQAPRWIMSAFFSFCIERLIRLVGDTSEQKVYDANLALRGQGESLGSIGGDEGTSKTVSGGCPAESITCVLEGRSANLELLES